MLKSSCSETGFFVMREIRSHAHCRYEQQEEKSIFNVVCVYSIDTAKLKDIYVRMYACMCVCAYICYCTIFTTNKSVSHKQQQQHLLFTRWPHDIGRLFTWTVKDCSMLEWNINDYKQTTQTNKFVFVQKPLLLFCFYLFFALKRVVGGGK